MRVPLGGPEVQDRAQVSDVLVIGYGALAVVHRMRFGSAPNPTWLILLCAATGCVWATLGRGSHGGRRVRATSFIAVLLIVLSGRQLFLLLAGSGLATHGFLGLVFREIITAGRTGPARRHTGWRAAVWSVVFLVFGGGSVVMAFVSP